MCAREVLVKIGLYLFGMTLEEDKSADGRYLPVLHFLLALFLEIAYGFMHEIGYAVFNQQRLHALHFAMMHKEI